jgi:cell division protein FtsB
VRYWEPAKRKKRISRKRATPPKRSIASAGSLGHYPFLRKFYQHQAVISVGLTKFIFFLVIATLLYVFVVGDAGIVRIMTLRHEKATIEDNLAMLDHSIESLEHEIDRLKNDPSAMEKLGRERYGFVYPGDRVYKIIRPAR